MRVYHFLSKEHAINNIENSRLKVATISDLNDPYEMYISLYENGVLKSEATREMIKSHFNGSMGILSFSTEMSNPVMWAHYADKQKGICMAFDVITDTGQTKFLREVHYQDEPTIIDIKTDADYENKFIGETTTKSSKWAYENEYRAPIFLPSTALIREKTETGKELIFVPFDKNLPQPKVVYTGVQCELSTAERKVFEDLAIEIVPTKKNNACYVIEPEKG